MQQKQQLETTLDADAQALIHQLEKVLGKLQAALAKERSPGKQFALIHLVEDLGIEEWNKISGTLNLHGWLALPLDEHEGFPLHLLRTTLEELTYLRDHDTLTGLNNRRFFDKKYQQEFLRAQRMNSPLSLVILDIDDFKKVNDSFGHPTGDTVLIRLGKILADSVRVYDIATRIGGEEFALILPGTSAIQAASLVARILEECRAVIFEAPEENVFSITFSAGIATFDACLDPIDAAELYKQADMLLYEAKRSGKNKICSNTLGTCISDNPALVKAEEKQFLFTGNHQL